MTISRNHENIWDLDTPCIGEPNYDELLHLICDAHKYIDRAAFLISFPSQNRIELQAAYPLQYKKRLESAINEGMLSVNDQVSLAAQVAREVVEGEKVTHVYIDDVQNRPDNQQYMLIDDEIVSEFAIPLLVNHVKPTEDAGSIGKKGNTQILAGVLVLSSTQKERLREAFKRYDTWGDKELRKSIAQTIQKFQNYVGWVTIRQHEEIWKRIFEELTTNFEVTHNSKYLQKVIDVFGQQVKHDLKYVSFWGIGKSKGNDILVKQKFYDYSNAYNVEYNVFNEQYDVKAIYKNDDWHSIYKCYDEVKKDIDKYGVVGYDPDRHAFIHSWKLSQVALRAKNQPLASQVISSFQMRRGYDDDDKVIIFPILSTDRKNDFLKGIVFLVCAKHSDSLMFDAEVDRHNIVKLSNVIGNQMEITLRNKRKTFALLTDLEENEIGFLNDVSRILRTVIKNTIRLVNCEVVAVFLREEDSTETTLSCVYYKNKDITERCTFVNADGSCAPLFGQDFYKYKEFEYLFCECESEHCIFHNCLKKAIKGINGEIGNKCYCLIGKIQKDHQIQGYVLFINKMSAISATLNSGREERIIDEFSHDEMRFQKTLVQYLSSQLALRSYYDKQFLSQSSQYHEITSHAQAIFNKIDMHVKRINVDSLEEFALFPDIMRYARNIQLLSSMKSILEKQLDEFEMKKIRVYDQIVSPLDYEFRPMATRRTLSLNCAFHSPSSSITGSKIILTIIIQNILQNAVKYSRQYTPIDFNAKIENRNLIIEARNLGIEIPFNDKSRIWTKGYRTLDARHSHESGSGLGLYLIHHFTKELGAGNYQDPSSVKIAHRQIFLLSALKQVVSHDYYSRLLDHVSDLTSDEEEVIKTHLSHSKNEVIKRFMEYTLYKEKKDLTPEVWAEYIKTQPIYCNDFRITVYNQGGE